MDGKPLMYLECAYKVARALCIASAQIESANQLDVQKIKDQVDALATWSDRLADVGRKARTIQNKGKLIEGFASDMKEQLDERVATILATLSSCEASGN